MQQRVSCIFYILHKLKAVLNLNTSKCITFYVTLLCSATNNWGRLESKYLTRECAQLIEAKLKHRQSVERTCMQSRVQTTTCKRKRRQTIGKTFCGVVDLFLCFFCHHHSATLPLYFDDFLCNLLTLLMASMSLNLFFLLLFVIVC